MTEVPIPPPDNDPPPGAMQQPVLLGPDIISSPVVSMVSWWLGAHSDVTTVVNLVVRNFRADDIFSAWSRLREMCQLAAQQPVQPPIRHRAEVKLAEEFVKEVFRG